MSLSAGMRLGPYEILAAIGAGGMGEVYRARDTRLDRDVAIKVLPAGSVGDADAEARFDREARAIAALNHPNICALYDVGRLDDRSFLVMELLDGETLHQRLTRGPFELGAFVDHAIALADALEAAHARGILHRDLKPANIILTARGSVKVLDFGLVKNFTASNDATRAADGRLTGVGSAIGTMGYMSPEQLRGDATDARSDLFSLGVVLYEMATGQRAFLGNTGAVVSAAILTGVPIAPRTLRVDLPERLEQTILETLEKDRDARCQSAAELRAGLTRLKRSIDASRHATTPEVIPGSKGQPPPAATPSSDRQMAVGLLKRHPIQTILAAVVGAAALISVVWIVRRSVTSPASFAPSAKLQIEPLTFGGSAQDGALSPDGRFVAYVHRAGASVSVWVRQLATQSDVQIVPPVAGGRIVGLSVTPDGSYVDFVASTPHDLWRVPFLGGTARRIASSVWSAIGWAPDGRHFAFIRANGIATEDSVIVADADGANQRVLATRHVPQRFLSDFRTDHPIARPSWSADGKTLLVLGLDLAESATVQTQALVVIDAATGVERAKYLLTGMAAFEAAWVDDAHVLVNAQAGGHELQLSLFDLRAEVMVPITQNLASFRGVSLTSDGLAAVSTRLDRRSGIWIGDGSGASLNAVVPETTAQAHGVMLDNRGGLVYNAATAVGTGIFSRVSVDAPPTLVIDDAGDSAVTSDGRTVIFVATAGGTHRGGLRRVNVDGSGLVPLSVGNNVLRPTLTRDDQIGLFVAANGGFQSLWAVRLAGGPPREVSHRLVRDARLSVSPNGRQLLFASRNGDRAITMLCDLPDCTNERELPVPSGVWTPDGRSVAYIDALDPWNIQVQPIEGGAPHALTHFTEKDIIDFAWSPDGRRLGITRGTTLADMVLIKAFR